MYNTNFAEVYKREHPQSLVVVCLKQRKIAQKINKYNISKDRKLLYVHRYENTQYYSV